ncbi:MAG: flavodoxin reductase [Flavobacteriales bacterium]|nr:flavodoxin reductase [Flavobacteriales bacterium]
MSATDDAPVLPGGLHRVEVLGAVFLNATVKRFTLSRPKGFRFTPGQGCMVSIDRDGWRDRARPFTFTALPRARTLELIVKIYDAHEGVTRQLRTLGKGEHLLLGEAFGTITYQGPGVFLAGGAGITPFLAILRQLHQDKALKGHTLIWSNRRADDLFLDDELGRMLGRHYLKTFTRENVIGFRDRRIDRDDLVSVVHDFDQRFYLCGPEHFVTDLKALLLELGAAAESMVFEA